MRKIILAILALNLVLVTGCWLKESYSMQYSFSNEMVTENKLQPKADGLELEIPFADFSCDTKSMKAVLDRRGNNFILNISGTETQQRCSEKFSAEISGIKPGTYWLKVIYRQGDSDQQVLYQQFIVSK